MGAHTTKLAQLPPRLIEISSHIGSEQTALLAAAFGGKKIKFPSGEMSQDHIIREVVTADAAQALHRLYRGERILIPSGAAHYRQKQVLLALKDGLLPREIAEELRVTPRAIEHIRCLLIAANLSPFPEPQSCA
jgi:DNA-binding NarL/FixJ family response regulator